MFGKPAMTCFEYQVYLYVSQAIIYLNALLWVVTEPSLWVIRLSPLPPMCGNITFTHLEDNSSIVKLLYQC